ncbi:MAG: hypothetical protein IJ129_00025 [Ruminococcus sp.]|nr:hypothetical protein [Ruminococcus sp.]
MKNINNKTVSAKTSSIIHNGAFAIASAMAAYYFWFSPDKANKWMSIVLLAGVLIPSGADLSKKHQLMAMGAGLSAGIAAGAAVILNVGFNVFNIRYSAVIFLAAAAVLSAAKAAFVLMENKRVKAVRAGL